MFTGLIEEIGRVKATRLESGNLILDVIVSKLSSDITIGDSVNINGACQTVVKYAADWFRVNTIAESLIKTNMKSLKVNDQVNLELALRSDSRLGGHMVSGHIDCTGILKTVNQISGSWEITIEYPDQFSELIVPKGSIAINGVSLTVTHRSSTEFGVSIIPHTWEITTFPDLRAGDTVNLEFDLIGKYIQQMIKPYISDKTSVTFEKFKRAGF